jgi:hypothetical protein
MKVFAGLLVVALLAIPGAEAGVFGLFGHKEKGYDASGKKLPKPIDSPIVRPKVREDHKVGKRAGAHPARFSRPEWGAEWDVIFQNKPKQFLPWVKSQD